MAERVTRATRVLRALPRAGACVTVPEIAKATQLPAKQVSGALVGLHGRGLVRRQRPGCYLVTDAGALARRQGDNITSGPCRPHSGRRKANRKATLRDKAWRAMRALGKFTIGDLLELTEASGRDPHSNLGRYLRALVAAGYLAELKWRDPGSARTSNGFKRYRLLRDSGLQAPRISQARKEVYDPNTQEVHPLERAAEAEAAGS